MIYCSQIVLTGPATGQVAYYWDTESSLKPSTGSSASVLILVKQGDARLMEIAAQVVRQLTTQQQALSPCQVLLDPTTAARLRHYYGVESDFIHLFEHRQTRGYGHDLTLEDFYPENADEMDVETCRFKEPDWTTLVRTEIPAPTHFFASAATSPRRKSSSSSSSKMATIFNTPDLICTIGGDGLLLHAGMLFQGKLASWFVSPVELSSLMVPFLHRTCPARAVRGGRIAGLSHPLSRR
jgi:hypothetical protein